MSRNLRTYRCVCGGGSPLCRSSLSHYYYYYYYLRIPRAKAKRRLNRRFRQLSAPRCQQSLLVRCGGGGWSSTLSGMWVPL